MTSSIRVNHSGPENAKIIIIGEAPGSDETRLRVPFVGQSGELLRNVLQQSGFNCASNQDVERDRNVDALYEIRFANIVNYQPEGNKFNSLTEREVNEGLSELQSYIRFNRSTIKLIISLGSTPLQYLLGKFGIERYRGTVFLYEGISVVPTYHPAYILRARSEYPIFSLDVGKAKRILDSGYSYPQPELIVNPDGYRLEELMYECEQSGRVSCDIESIKHTNKILCVGFGLGRNKAFCIPNTSTDGLDPTLREACERLLVNDKIEKIFHNGMYDVEVFHNNQVEVRGFKHDTMIMQHVLALEMEKGLDNITSIYTDLPYYKDKGKMTIPENEKGWSDTKNLDRYTLYEYNCMDCIATFWCFEEMLKEIEEDECFKITYPQEMSMHEVAFELTRNGMLRDENRTKEIKRAVESKFIEDQKILNAVTGKNVNTGSAKQKKELLYTQWGLPVRSGKEPGKISTDEDAIVSLIGFTKDHISGLRTEAAKFEWQKKLAGLMCILKIQGYRKLLGSYVDIDLHPDGRIRSTYKIPGTNTGRWSCSKYLDDTGLNAQTMPREALDVSN